MKTIKRIAGTIGFILVFLLIFSEVSELLMHKQIEGRWNMTDKVAGFYNEEPNSMDVIFFGSSHMYCSVDPAIFHKETGLDSYVFATQQQPLWITYYYMKEALKTQRPNLMAVEVHMAIHDGEGYLDEATNHAAIDPIPMSGNKLDMIKASVPIGERRHYIFNIMKYHDRWEELKMSDYLRDYKNSTDPYKGYVKLDEVSEDVEWEDVSRVTESDVANTKNLYYISKIIELAKEENISLLLFKAPSNATADEKRYYNYVGEMAINHDIEYIDFNTSYHYEKIGLDVARDFYDKKHLNASGVSKFVPYFCGFLP